MCGYLAEVDATPCGGRKKKRNPEGLCFLPIFIKRVHPVIN